MEEFAEAVKLLAQIATVLVIQPQSIAEAGSSSSWAADWVKNGWVARHRFLNYKTEVGKIALVRQLNPNVHIEFDKSVADQLCPHVKVVHVGRAVNAASSNSGSGNKKTIWKSIPSIQDLLR
jgi:hypothetical protein